MIDKITIRCTLTDEECAHLSHLHYLHSWVNESGTRVEYRSSEYSKISGIEIKITQNRLTLRCSLHKYWQERNFGRLRNDNMFTISEARAAFEMLMFENNLSASRVKVSQVEIGLNLEVTHDPLSFIERVTHISSANRTSKIMFIDANYHINRQKTSEKYKDIRRYFKIYDKGWEMAEKKRKTKAPPTDDERKILRIETVYRRMTEKAPIFFTESNLQKLANRFWLDWKDLFFLRKVRADKGRRKSEKTRAENIINYGAEYCLQKAKDEYKRGDMTEKQFRTEREFIRDFDTRQDMFHQTISKQENEYTSLLISTFAEAKK